MATSTLAVKGIIIGEKCPRGETIDIAPATKGKPTSESKDKETMSPPLTKKTTMWRFKTPLTEVTSTSTTVMVAGEGTSANTTMLRSAAMVEKVLEAAILPFDKEEVEKLEFD